MFDLKLHYILVEGPVEKLKIHFQHTCIKVFLQPRWFYDGGVNEKWLKIKALDDMYINK